MNELKIEQEKGKEEFLGHLIYWCFRWGCEVRLTNKAWNHPVMQPEKDYWARGEFHEQDKDGSLVDMAHRTNYKTIEIPELTFYRKGRSISIYGSTWDDLMNAVKHQYRRVYMELSVPLMPKWDKP